MIFLEATTNIEAQGVLQELEQIYAQQFKSTDFRRHLNEFRSEVDNAACLTTIAKLEPLKKYVSNAPLKFALRNTIDTSNKNRTFNLASYPVLLSMLTIYIPLFVAIKYTLTQSIFFYFILLASLLLVVTAVSILIDSARCKKALFYILAYQVIFEEVYQ